MTASRDSRSTASQKVEKEIDEYYTGVNISDRQKFYIEDRIKKTVEQNYREFLERFDYLNENAAIAQQLGFNDPEDSRVETVFQDYNFIVRRLAAINKENRQLKADIEKFEVALMKNERVNEELKQKILAQCHELD